MDVTDDKTLGKAVCKQRQIDHAAHISDQAKLVKLADKISNLRDVASNPPSDRGVEPCQEYFDRAKAVIGRLGSVHGPLEGLFDSEYANRP